MADSDKFPEDWLFKHRWGKGKKNTPSVLPNGERITFLTVGGRTSAVVPSVQKKTGPVTKGASGEDTSDTQSNSKRKRSAIPKEESDSEVKGDEPKPKKTGSKAQPKKPVKTEDKEEEKTADLGRRRSTRLRK